MMDLIKKNIMSIVCGVIALVAVGALFWPVSGYFEELKTRVGERKGVASGIKQLTTKTRMMPKTQLDGMPAEEKNLEIFPNRQTIDQGDALIKQVKDQSLSVLDAAVKLNTHEPLLPDVLPGGASTLMASLVNYCQKYRQTMSISSSEESRKQSYLVALMNGGFPPTDAEIEAVKKSEEERIRKKLIPDVLTGQPLNREQVEGEIAATIPYVAEKMRKEAAERCQLYIDFNAFDPYASLNRPDQNNPELYEIYLGQLGLWVHEDVAKSIKKINEGSKNVMESPVKHLKKIKLPDELFRFSGAAREVVAPNAAGKIEPNTQVSASGRQTNPLFDIIRFNLTIVVEADKVPQILHELSRDKFLTVLEFDMTTHDAALWKTVGYYYGDKPLVQLDLMCEDLFFRSWTAPLMPAQIKLALGVGDPAAKPAEAK